MVEEMSKDIEIKPFQPSSLHQLILEQYRNDLDNTIFKMLGTTQSTSFSPTNYSSSFSLPKPEPDILTTYPITHDKYRRINRGPSTIDGFLRGLLPFDAQSVETITKQLNAGNLEVYAAMLRDARLHFSEIPIDSVPSFAQNGYVYDPWFREITGNPIKFKLVSTDKITMSVLPNATSHLLYYILDTTVEGKSVRLFIYQIVKLGYKNSVDTRNHLQKLNPYAVLHMPEYDFNVSP